MSAPRSLGVPTSMTLWLNRHTIELLDQARERETRSSYLRRLCEMHLYGWPRSKPTTRPWRFAKALPMRNSVSIETSAAFRLDLTIARGDSTWDALVLRLLLTVELEPAYAMGS